MDKNGEVATKVDDATQRHVAEALGLAGRSVVAGVPARVRVLRARCRRDATDDGNERSSRVSGTSATAWETDECDRRSMRNGIVVWIELPCVAGTAAPKLTSGRRDWRNER